MPQTLLTNTPLDLEYQGPEIFNQSLEFTHNSWLTIQILLANFRGRLIIEASADREIWYPLQFSDEQGNTYPWLEWTGPFRGASLETLGATGTRGYTVQGNHKWLRSRMTRTHLLPPPSPETLKDMGQITGVLIN